MLSLRHEAKVAALLVGSFLFFYFLPLDSPRFQGALLEGLALLHWYAQEHVILCLIPAFFIAGAIAVFGQAESVMRYLGPTSPRVVAYGVGSISGALLAVCSCTVLPLFAGIWRRGAGLGPAVAFLYSGPAISVLAVILTARLLGLEMGLARALGAVLCALIIGALMGWIFRREQRTVSPASSPLPEAAATSRPLWQTASWLALMVAVLIFSNWSEAEQGTGFFAWVAQWKWELTSVSALGLVAAMGGWFRVAWWKLAAAVGLTSVTAWLAQGHAVVPFAVATAALVTITATTPGEMRAWLDETWQFTKLIAPMLLAGVFVAGFLLGRPGEEGLMPMAWVVWAVGGNDWSALFLSSLLGALMYFATLTEIPILQGLIANGMGPGPALTLLLAGPALSLPSILALGKILGPQKTLTYAALVVILSAAAGFLYGHLV